MAGATVSPSVYSPVSVVDRNGVADVMIDTKTGKLCLLCKATFQFYQKRLYENLVLYWDIDNSSQTKLAGVLQANSHLANLVDHVVITTTITDTRVRCDTSALMTLINSICPKGLEIKDWEWDGPLENGALDPFSAVAYHTDATFFSRLSIIEFVFQDLVHLTSIMRIVVAAAITLEELTIQTVRDSTRPCAPYADERWSFPMLRML
ncbi:MAG: hypothetical protein CYPHOPRED_004664 [Cyphobasidiales sp. Tagirdzhanova-0007]|nr:MAG: hypothetical protein CYPHOPRED_004664 [Cyphobasidiales sp. Tagirdzhanova-0007]